jgi:hypothetical protein
VFIMKCILQKSFSRFKKSLENYFSIHHLP